MDSFPAADIVGVTICILFSAYFSGTETALTTLSEAKKSLMCEKYTFVAPILKKWTQSPSLVLSSILVGNNIVNILGAVLAGNLASSALEKNYGSAVAGAVAVAVMTVIVLIFGEITPKTFAKMAPEKWLVPALILFRVIDLLLRPFAIVLSKLANSLVKIMGGGDEVSEVTENEIEYLIQKGSDEGVFEQEEQGEMLTSVIEFKDTIVKEIMTPRTETDFLECGLTINEAIGKIGEWGHSRIPVYEDSIDNIKGILYVKDLAMLVAKNSSVLNDKISTVARNNLFYVPETQKINETLKKMREEGTHIGIVVDEFGGTSGIITLEDILEEIVGEIRDENDKDEKPFEIIREDVASVDAHISISDLEEDLDISIPEDGDYNSLGGFIVSQIGYVPPVGFLLKYKNYEFKILDSNEKHIVKVEVRILSENGEEKDDPGSRASQTL